MEYRAADERRLTDRLPAKPAAVRVYGHDGSCSTLFLDLDSSRGGADAVAREATRLVKWLAECGARVIEDVSPNGGRHIYVPLAQRLDLAAAREIVEALALRFPTIDASPHRSARSGCIRTPGSRHKTGGHQQLVTTLATAVDVLHRRNTPTSSTPCGSAWPRRSPPGTPPTPRRPLPTDPPAVGERGGAPARSARSSPGSPVKASTTPPGTGRRPKHEPRSWPQPPA
ncbi:hypothetical protein [Cellulomonas denverensis]|uniref:hypothetical protein n=1 Tax=Cellulomonas denverensis TaxID=264297 RepID=UPI0035E89CB6